MSILTEKNVTEEEVIDYAPQVIRFYSFWNEHFKDNKTQVVSDNISNQ